MNGVLNTQTQTLQLKQFFKTQLSLFISPMRKPSPTEGIMTNPESHSQSMSESYKRQPLSN